MKIIGKLCLFIMILGLIACQPKKGRGGGVDGGGGEASKSTPEQVRLAIEEGVHTLTHPDPRYNIAFQFLQKMEPNHEAKILLDLSETSLGDDKVNLNISKSVLLALKTNGIQLKDHGDCPSPDAKHADASVSAFNTSASICVAVGNLRRLPPQSLRAEVWALLIHEASHMAGADEALALRIQSDFRKFISVGFPDYAPDLGRRMIIEHVQKIRLSLSQAMKDVFKRSDGKPERQRLIEAANKIDSVPLMLEPLRMKVFTQPRRPELYDNWANTFLAAKAKLYALTLQITRGIRPEYKENAYQRRTTESVYISLLRAEHALQVYLFGGEASSCELPEPQGASVEGGRLGAGRRIELNIKPFKEVYLRKLWGEPSPSDSIFSQTLSTLAPPRKCVEPPVSGVEFDGQIGVEELRYHRTPEEDNLSKLSWLTPTQSEILKSCTAKEKSDGAELAAMYCLLDQRLEWTEERKERAFKDLMLPALLGQLKRFPRDQSSIWPMFYEPKRMASIDRGIELHEAALAARDAGDEMLWLSSQEGEPHKATLAKGLRTLRGIAKSTAPEDEVYRLHAMDWLNYLERRYLHVLRQSEF